MTYREGAPDPLEVRRDTVLERIRTLMDQPLSLEDDNALAQMVDSVQDARTINELAEIEKTISETEKKY